MNEKWFQQNCHCLNYFGKFDTEFYVWRWSQVSCCRNNGWKFDQPYQEFVQSNLSLSFRPMWSVSGDAFSLFMKMRNNRFVYRQPHHWRIAMWLMVKGSNGYYCVAQCGELHCASHLFYVCDYSVYVGSLLCGAKVLDFFATSSFASSANPHHSQRKCFKQHNGKFTESIE